MDIHDEILKLPLVRELPAGVPNIDWMTVAAHEIGHAVAFDHGGFDVQHIKMETSWWDNGLKGGYNVVEDEPDEDEDTALDLYLVGILAGGEAAAYCIQHYLDVPEADAYATAWAGCGGDHTEFKRLARKPARRKPARRIQQDARQLVSAKWRGIERYAAKLSRKRSLAGSAL